MRRAKPSRPPLAPEVDEVHRRSSPKETAQSAMSGWKDTGATSSTANAGRRVSKPAERMLPTRQYRETLGKLHLYSHEPVLFRQRKSERTTSLPRVQPPGLLTEKEQGDAFIPQSKDDSLDGSWAMYSTLTTDPDLTFSDSSQRKRDSSNPSSISSSSGSRSSQCSKDSDTRKRSSKANSILDLSLSPDSHGTSESPVKPTAYAEAPAIKPEEIETPDSDRPSGSTPPLNPPEIVRQNN